MKTPRMGLMGMLLVLSLAGCISFDVEETFCANATTAQQQAICGQDGGTSGNPDAGVELSCDTSSTCNAPPNQCLEPQGTCVSGRCEYPPKKTGTACNDATPTSSCYSASGTCAAGVCKPSLKPKGAACDDGQPCTVKDVCDGAGKCDGDSPFFCDAPPSQCYEALGACVDNACTYKLKATGTSCDDGDKCTDNDQCNSAGTCVSQTATCPDRSEFCQDRAGCDKDRGCLYTNRCSEYQTCQYGRCTNSLGAGMKGAPGEQCLGAPQDPR